MKYEKKKQRVASKRRKTQKFISVKYENFLLTKYIQWLQESLMSKGTEKPTSLPAIQKFTELTVGPRGNSGAGEPTGHPHGLKPIRRSHSWKVETNVLKWAISKGRNPKHGRSLP